MFQPANFIECSSKSVEQARIWKQFNSCGGSPIRSTRSLIQHTFTLSGLSFLSLICFVSSFLCFFLFVIYFTWWGEGGFRIPSHSIATQRLVESTAVPEHDHDDGSAVRRDPAPARGFGCRASCLFSALPVRRHRIILQRCCWFNWKRSQGCPPLHHRRPHRDPMCV